MKPYVRWLAAVVVIGVPVAAVIAHHAPDDAAAPAEPSSPPTATTTPPASAPTSAPTSAPVTVGPSADPRVYGLQALLEFDTLDGADYDPTTKTLVLAGSTTLGEHGTMVPYLHYLAGALEATAPTFSLEWLPESKRELERARLDPGFLEAKDASGKLTPFGVWLFHDVAGADATAATTYVDAGTQLVERGGFEKAFAGKGVLQVPPAIVPTTFPAVPMVRAIVKGMPPTSLLAHVALEADVAAKSLIESAELAARVPGYVPYSAWERTHGEVSGSQRVEIQPARFEVTESADGKSMRFGRADMRFKMEQMTGAVSTPRQSLTEYAALLSTQYDAFAQEIPVLHQLREAMKVLALVAWARRHGWELDLPAAGRPSIPMPEALPGVVHILLTISLPKPTSLRLHSTLWEAGGVDLRFGDDTLVVKVGDVQPYPVVTPVVEANAELQRIAAHKTDVPLPEIPGWVKPATGGKDAKGYLAIAAADASKCKDPAAVNRQLDVVRRRVAELDGYDRMINAQTKSRVQALAELQALADTAKHKRDDMLWWFVKKGASLGWSVHKLHGELMSLSGLPSAPAPKLLEYTDYLKKTGDVLDDANAAANRHEDSAAYWRKIAQELEKLTGGLETTFRQLQLVNSATARWFGARANLAVALTFLLHEYTMKLVDIQLMLEDVRTLDDRMRAGADDSKTIQQGRQTAEDAYLKERAELNTLLATCAR